MVDYLSIIKASLDSEGIPYTEEKGKIEIFPYEFLFLSNEFVISSMYKFKKTYSHSEMLEIANKFNNSVNYFRFAIVNDSFIYISGIFRMYGNETDFEKYFFEILAGIQKITNNFMEL